MKKLFILMATTLLISACGGGSSNYDQVMAKLCEGQDEAKCQKMKDKFETMLTGPNKEQFSQAQKDKFYEMILTDKDGEKVLQAYKTKILADLGQ